MPTGANTCAPCLMPALNQQATGPAGEAGGRLSAVCRAGPERQSLSSCVCALPVKISRRLTEDPAGALLPFRILGIRKARVLPTASRRHPCVTAVFDPTRDVRFDLRDEEELSPDIPLPPPPSQGRIEIVVTAKDIKNLDLSAAHKHLRQYVDKIGNYTSPSPSDLAPLLDCRVGFTIQYEREDPLDPRELSELPDVRLWFIRLDVAYPWLPMVLDWRGGELGRYAAMLIPHQMSRRLGLVFNPEALDLWVMKKVFVVYDWLKANGVARPDVKVRDLIKVLGFGGSEQLFGLLETFPNK